ncbi:cyanophycinase [Undibacterium sp. TS12]|uniref:cyanophycinase n=1 Tax=Undibacterium sp. TS12 TaxID=2908202 RepID=UPI001F4D09D5|nr:cyanophycinase [Undibacterium sp. TS12]MCH8622595.1 cyanophycinase [Undibacterium sp. TS12]
MNSHAEDTSPQQSTGSLVIIGGALRMDNAGVWQRIVQQAGGKGAKIAVIPAAAGSPEKSGAFAVESLNQNGAQAFLIPLSVKHAQFKPEDIVSNAAWLDKLKDASGVYFTGGDQGRIIEALVRPDGSRTAMLDAIWALYQRGGVIAGSSAGAAIMSTTMFYDAKPVLPTLKLGVTDGKEIAAGLGFIGPDVFIDQHLIIRGRFARMLPVMLKKNYRLGLGVDENTAMVVNNQGEVEVIGYKGAILFDLSQATTDDKQKNFNISNARISYLDRGDRFNLRSKVLTPAADKLAGKLSQTQAYQSDQRFYPDILANTVLTDLMFHLMDGKQERAIGLAFGMDAQPELGFEFSFSKVAESQGYYSGASGAESYTVHSLRLDIRPVSMNLPLYK